MKELLKFNELLLVANGWELQRIGSDYKEALRLIKYSRGGQQIVIKIGNEIS